MHDTGTKNNPWLRRYGAGLEARVICFPHAGGSANFFLALAKSISRDLEIVAIQYPGRQDRLHEPAIGSIDALADQVHEALKPITDRPVVLVGHSMGAIVAFEVARRISVDLPDRVQALIVSSQRAPSLDHAGTTHRESDAELLARIRDLYGDAFPSRTDPRVIRPVLATIRADLRAIENYQYVPGELLSCDITAVVGDADPMTSVEAVDRWRDHTQGRFERHVLTGRHFPVLDHLATWADLVQRAV